MLNECDLMWHDEASEEVLKFLEDKEVSTLASHCKAVDKRGGTLFSLQGYVNATRRCSRSRQAHCILRFVLNGTILPLTRAWRMV